MIVLHLEHPDHGLLIVSRMFDEQGNDTVDLEDIAAVVAQLPSGEWLSMEASADDLVLCPIDAN